MTDRYGWEISRISMLILAPDNHKKQDNGGKMIIVLHVEACR